MAIIIAKTELGTKATRSQLCINIVLRRYANKGSFTKLSLLFEYSKTIRDNP